MKLCHIHIFFDGTTIEWLDKESLKYCESSYVAMIWVDYGPGFFKIKRVLKTESILQWQEAPEGADRQINEQKKKEIILKVQLYYALQNVKCDVNIFT